MSDVLHYSTEILTKSGSDILDPDNYTFKKLKERLGRDPVLSDFDGYYQQQYAHFLKLDELLRLFESGRTDLHIKLNNGARRGSIAKITSPPKVARSSYGAHIDYGSPITVAWDNGKTWTFAFYTNVMNCPEGQHHSILINYTEPTVYCFEKNNRPALPITVLKDNYGRILEVGHWVMDATFKIGRISRISPKGTIWIDVLQQRAGKYIRKSSTVQFGKPPSELLRIDLPEGFEVTATIMDKDITGLDIIPTFTYQARYD